MKRTSSDNSHWRLQFAIETLSLSLPLFGSLDLHTTNSQGSNIVKTYPAKTSWNSKTNLLAKTERERKKHAQFDSHFWRQTTFSGRERENPKTMVLNSMVFYECLIGTLLLFPSVRQQGLSKRIRLNETEWTERGKAENVNKKKTKFRGRDKRERRRKGEQET